MISTIRFLSNPPHEGKEQKKRHQSTATNASNGKHLPIKGPRQCQIKFITQWWPLGVRSRVIPFGLTIPYISLWKKQNPLGALGCGGGAYKRGAYVLTCITRVISWFLCMRVLVCMLPEVKVRMANFYTLCVCLIGFRFESECGWLATVC